METPVSLLKRIRVPGNHADWERFATLYYPLVLSWAWRACGSYHNALDLTQTVFLNVHRSIHTFERQKSGAMRAWLRQILRNELTDLRAKRFPDLVDFNEVCELQSIRRSGSPESIAYDELFHQACDLARPEFSTHAWAIFERTFIQGEDMEAVATDLGVTKNALYVVRTRVIRRLKEILAENIL
jgi:RNA polymerase sigma-70 factor (ECF subfamily)